MSELKDELIEIKDYLKKARIYYKVVGSDKIHTITPVTYGFLKGKVFDLERHSYKVKDNISYIHFYKSLVCDDKNHIESLTADSNTKVEITVESGKYNFKVNASDICIKDEDKFNIQVKGLNAVIYYTPDGLLDIDNASKTIIDGNIDFSRIAVFSSLLEMYNTTKDIDYLSQVGNNIRLYNVNCNIRFFSTNAKTINVKNSNIQSHNGGFNECIKPTFVNSIWKFEGQLDYIDGTLGNSETGIVLTNGTFSKESIELARAYAAYGLREFLNNVEANNEADISHKLEVIDEKKRALIEEYYRQVATLEDKKDVIINGYQKRKVKNLVNKKEN